MPCELHKIRESLNHILALNNEPVKDYHFAEFAWDVAGSLPEVRKPGFSDKIIQHPYFAFFKARVEGKIDMNGLPVKNTSRPYVTALMSLEALDNQARYQQSLERKYKDAEDISKQPAGKPDQGMARMPLNGKIVRVDPEERDRTISNLQASEYACRRFYEDIKYNVCRDRAPSVQAMADSAGVFWETVVAVLADDVINSLRQARATSEAMAKGASR